MVVALKKIWRNHQALWLALLIFWAGTFAFLDAGKHFAFNLEPYPDGLFYTVPAWNFVFGDGFSMSFEGSAIRYEVPLLYPLLLIHFYLIFQTPVAFYFFNMLLGSGTLVFLYLLLKENFKSIKLTLLTPLFATLPVLLWLPALPMAENLLLFLITVTLWLWATKKVSEEKKLIFLALSQVLLFASKYSAYAFIIAFNTLFVWQLFQQKKHRQTLFYLLLSGLLFLGVVLLLKPPFIWNTFVTHAKSTSGLVVFSTNYLQTNIVQYAKALMGMPNFFLWERMSLLPIGLMLIPLVDAVISLKNKRQKTSLHNYLFLIGGILLFQSFFYAFDSRYLIPILPLVFLAVAKSLEHYGKNVSTLTWSIVLGGFVALTIITNLAFYRKVISSNWLQRSRAWQYEAILHFNQTVPNDGLIVTALPPFLFNFYQTQNYRILPLSPDQEFLSKRKHIWGDDIDYNNLQQTYQAWLEEGRELYISNAYITHQQSVIKDYESYKENFEFELVTGGCEQACNIYRLSLK